MGGGEIMSLREIEDVCNDFLVTVIGYLVYERHFDGDLDGVREVEEAT